MIDCFALVWFHFYHIPLDGNAIFEWLRVSDVPLLHGLQWYFASQYYSLGWFLVVQPDIAKAGCFQLFATFEIMALQDVFNTAAKTLNHAIKLVALSATVFNTAIDCRPYRSVALW